MLDALIIGGGAAGMAAAIAAGMCGERVLVLERMDRVGKKLLATGNGRCNLMNLGPLRYPGGTALAQAVLARCGAEAQAAFWNHWGLPLRTEDGGRVYPASGQASTVLDTLRLAMTATGADIVAGAAVTEIRHHGNSFTVTAGSQTWQARRVIAAGGGCAQPKLGSDGSAWALLEHFGHQLLDPRPSLTQIMTDTAPIRGLSGIRVRCRVAVLRSGKTLHEESGELLFADYGVSGVCVMQCARWAEPGCELRIDLTQGMGFAGEAGLAEELRRRMTLFAGHPTERLLTGLCVPRLASCLLKAACLRREDPIDRLADAALDRLARVMAGFRLDVRGVKGFDSAQVTAGGLDIGDFDPATMESLYQPGLHACGEMLDVDGDCGGYNLMFAFGSGLLAGLNGREIPWRSL